MDLKSSDIITLHAYLPPQHAVKAKSAPGGFCLSSCKFNAIFCHGTESGKNIKKL